MFHYPATPTWGGCHVLVAVTGGRFVKALNSLEVALGWLETSSSPQGAALAPCSSSSPSLPSWEQPSLTRGGSGGGSLLWVLTFTGLQRPLPFSFTCFLLLTTPILSESTHSRLVMWVGLQSLSTEELPQLLPGGQLERRGGSGRGSEGQNQNMKPVSGWAG